MACQRHASVLAADTFVIATQMKGPWENSRGLFFTVRPELESYRYRCKRKSMAYQSYESPLATDPFITASMRKAPGRISWGLFLCVSPVTVKKATELLLGGRPGDSGNSEVRWGDHERWYGCIHRHHVNTPLANVSDFFAIRADRYTIDRCSRKAGATH